MKKKMIAVVLAGATLVATGAYAQESVYDKYVKTNVYDASGKVIGQTRVGTVSLPEAKNSKMTMDQVYEELMKKMEMVPLYKETTVKRDQKGKIVTSTAKEWYSPLDKGYRIEEKDNTGVVTYNVFNGKSSLTYREGAKSASEITAASEQKVVNNDVFYLRELKNNHQLQFLGEETINNRATYHIMAIPTEKDDLQVEMWMDKETGVAMKSITTVFGLQGITEVTKLDFYPEFTKGLFELTMPSDVKVYKDMQFAPQK
ncbi:LolA family protein [Brevibacillus laterosporus]|uniref:LolA family protein n=1 Tax=Brevibacillus laterosporus TaxID=1465 RepID=UPI0018CCBA30|nr:hypothetical protein [Brevibacillus laterosporus]MBG9789408.1 hypothetical protein [Brevibacillus laterosporus]MCG7317249.1 hypothetical protein [Brevibacillus laterosporus]